MALTNKVGKKLWIAKKANGGKKDFEGEGSESVMLEREKWQKINNSFPRYLYLYIINIHSSSILNKYKKQLQKIEWKVGMEYQKAYKQG